MVGLVIISCEFSNSACAFAVGDTVKVTSSNGVNVRITAGGTYLGGQLQNAIGKIVSGPTSAPYGGVTYTWWKIDFTSGSDGWVIQDGIAVFQPDLSFSAQPSASPSTVAPGATVNVKYTVKNIGTASSNSCQTLLILRDANNNPNNPLGTAAYTTQALSAGGTVQETRGITVPSSLSSGSYKVVVVLDNINQAGQSAAGRANDVSNAANFSVGTPPLSISSTAFNPSMATVGVGYAANQAMQATGGQSPYTWSATGLPSGMSINTTTGAPFGTPTVSGTFNVTIMVKDSSSPQLQASKTLSLTVNPSSLSITSTAFNPSTATVGVGYAANQAMQATGGQSPYTWSATGFPSGMSINATTGAPFGTPTVSGTFNVTIMVKDSSSPQLQASKTLSLTVLVLQPDLVPSQVTVTPTSFALGQQITVSLTIANNGDGDAVASKSRLRINGSTTTTSPADVSLGDIDTPAIPAHQQRIVSKSAAVSGVVPGTYYIWVSVDNTSVTHQNNSTNDFAHSAALSISTSNVVQPPSNVTITPPVTITSGQTAALTVTSSGTGPFTFRWYRNNLVIPDTDKATIHVSADGDYFVNVSNAGGTQSSPTTHVTVTDVPLADRDHEEGLIIQYRWVGRHAPTVVITHGWQQESTSDLQYYLNTGWQQIPAGALNIADAVYHRPDLATANILVYLWRGAYTLNGDAAIAYVSSKGAGHVLAANLEALLGSDYNTTQYPIHFIGHSFGTFVNAAAAARLDWHINQFTILDAPISKLADLGIILSERAFALAGAPTAHLFYDALPPGKADFVDNYVAKEPVYGFAVLGAPIPGAAPNNGGELLADVSHITIQNCFYAPSISKIISPADCPDLDIPIEGDAFDHSVLLFPNGESNLSRWDPSPQNQAAQSSGITSLAIPIGGFIDYVYDSVSGEWQSVLRFFNLPGSTARPARAGDLRPVVPLTGTGTKDVSTEDSSAVFNVTVPGNATLLNFKFSFEQLGGGDWMTVSFNDRVVYSFTGANFVGSDYDIARVPVSSIAGQTGVLTITLHSISEVPAELRVADLRFEAQTYALQTTGTNGNVTKDPNQPTYEADSQVRLTAVPASGYVFTGWSGDARGSDNPLTVTMDNDKAITANFTPLPPPGPAVSFGDWRIQYFTAAQLSDANISGWNADADHDGMSNGAEWFSNLNPASGLSAAEAAALPRVAKTSAGFFEYLTFTYRRRIGLPGFSSRVCVSDNLADWDRSESQIESGNPVPTGDGITETVTVRLKTPINTGGQKFIRLEINQGGADMVQIPAGTFDMGNPLNSAEGASSELPVHAVTLSTFYIDRYEITKTLWDDVRAWGSTHGYTDLPVGSTKGADHPVNSIDWYSAVKWCNARSEKDGLTPAYYTDNSLTTIYKTGVVNVVSAQVNWNTNGYRLPTEAEWEKAARGGQSGQRYPWSLTISRNEANYFVYSTNGNTPFYPYDLAPTLGFDPTYNDGVAPYTSPGGSFSPNGYGLFDVIGNVWEWCWDGWDATYYSSSPSVDPKGPTVTTQRIVRGGGWTNSDARDCRLSTRGNNEPNRVENYNGFRSVRR